MTARTKRLLLMIADAVDKAPAKEFDMSSWDCGTTACAIGWACRDPRFRRQTGLMVVRLSPSFVMRGRDNLAGFSAIANSLGIDYDDAGLLFSREAYPEFVLPSTVSARIRRFVKTGRIE